MTGENIRNALHAGTPLYGTHITGLTNALVTRLLGSAPLDYVFICNEHIPVDRAETSALCQHWACMGKSPIVRIASPDTVQAAMALDAGAEGIVAPYVETVDEVRRLVGSVHYRPIKGQQLRQALDGSHPLPRKTREYLRRFNRHHYVIIGVESVHAYENLDALIGVEGVDGVFMGPHDLSVSLNAPEEWDNPALLHLIEDVIRRCRSAGIGVGVHMSYIFPEVQIRRFINAGMNWILDGADINHVLHGLKERRELFLGAIPARHSQAIIDTSLCIAPGPSA